MESSHIPLIAGNDAAFWKDERAGVSGKEVAMFQILNDGSTEPEDRRIKTARVGALTIALLALGAMVYFFAFLPYATR
jgi:hypothetical protein